MNERVSYFDNLRLALIYFVILGHFCEISVQATEYGRIIFFFIYTFHMPLFIYVGGLFNRETDRQRSISRACGFFAMYLLMKCVSLIDRTILFDDHAFRLFSEGGMPWFLFAMAAFVLLAYITRNMNKKYLLVISIIIALAAGYDNTIASDFVASRIIVFWPFFLAGMMTDKEKLLSLVQNKSFKLASVILLAGVMVLIVLYYDRISFLGCMFSGRNPYSALPEQMVAYGALIRIGVYGIISIMSILVMAAVPSRAFIGTKYGQRTLTIYFFNLVTYHITKYFFPELRIWKAILVSFILIPITGVKPVNDFFNKIVKGEFLFRNNKS